MTLDGWRQILGLAAVGFSAAAAAHVVVDEHVDNTSCSYLNLLQFDLLLQQRGKPGEKTVLFQSDGIVNVTNRQSVLSQKSKALLQMQRSSHRSALSHALRIIYSSIPTGEAMDSIEQSMPLHPSDNDTGVGVIRNTEESGRWHLLQNPIVFKTLAISLAILGFGLAVFAAYYMVAEDVEIRRQVSEASASATAASSTDPCSRSISSIRDDDGTASQSDPPSMIKMFGQLANVLVPILLCGIAGGIATPLSSYIALNFFAQRHTELGPQDIHCEWDPQVEHCKVAVNDEVTASAISQAAACVLVFFLGPTLGVISDAYGRKPVIIVYEFMAAISAFAKALFVFYNVSLYWWYACRLFCEVPIWAVWFAAYTDMMPLPESRAYGFSLLLVAHHFALLVGVVISSCLTVESSSLVYFILRVIIVVYVATWLQETLPPERRAPLKATALYPVSGFMILFSSRTLRTLTTIFMLNEFASYGLQTIGLSYFQKYFGFDQLDSNFQYLCIQASLLVWMCILSKPLLQLVGEVGLLVAGQLVSIVYNVCTYFVYTPSHIFMLTGLFSGGTYLLFPATAALKGGCVSDSEQGHLQGAVQAALSIATLFGPAFFGAMFNTIDAYSGVEAGATGHQPSAAIFLVAAVIRCFVLPLNFTLPTDILRSKSTDILRSKSGLTAKDVPLH